MFLTVRMMARGLPFMIFLLVACLGCSGGGDPMLPVTQIPITEGQSVYTVNTESNRHLWGLWQFVCNIEKETIEVKPLRTPAGHLNIVEYLETDFKGPLRYGDNIEVEVKVLTLGTSSIKFGYRVFRKGEGTPRVTGHNITVCVDMKTFEKKGIPEFLRNNLETLLD